MKIFNKIISLFATASLLAASIAIPTAVTAAETPATPLYLFRDTMESYLGVENAAGNGDTLIGGIWRTSSTFGSYSSEYNISSYDNGKVITLTPGESLKGRLCVLNLDKFIPQTRDYVFSVDLNGISTTSSGIRIANPDNEKSYYELSLSDRITFAKVTAGTSSTPVTESEWDYSEQDKQISDRTATYTLSLGKKGNSIHWAVYAENGEILYSSSYLDNDPLFSGMGKLQLFAYSDGGGSCAVFDNADVRKLGAKLYKDSLTNKVKLEASWIEATQPYIAVADYDENGRVLEVQRFYGEKGYLSTDAPLTIANSQKKLFLWDAETSRPICDASLYVDTDAYEVPASEYVHQSDRISGTRFSEGGGIRLKTLGTVKVSPDAKLILNSEEAYITLSDAYLDKFLGNAQGTIRFEKTQKDSIYYDRIYADYYIVGTVTSVQYKNEKTTINIDMENDCPDWTYVSPSQNLTLIVDDESVAAQEVDISVERNGENISLSGIKKNDVLAIKPDFPSLEFSLAANIIVDPATIEVIATDRTISGIVFDFDDYNRTCSIDGVHYPMASPTLCDELTIGVTYRLHLDPFGRITYNHEAIATLEKFAILEKYDANLDKVTILLADGTTASYEIHTNSTLRGDDVYVVLRGYYGSGSVSTPQTAPEERVVSYRISNGAIKLISLATPYVIQHTEYNPHTNKLGPVYITDNLSIIDATEYMDNFGRAKISDYKPFTDEFEEDREYTAYAFQSCGVYSFMIITEIRGGTFTKTSRFAVVTKYPYIKLYDGEPCWCFDALYQGETVTLPVYDGYSLSEGDVIFFTTDDYGFVENYYIIGNRQSIASPSQFTGIYELLDWDLIDQDLWQNGFERSMADIQLVNAPIVEVKNNTMTFGVVSTDYDGNNIIDANIYDSIYGDCGLYTYEIADDCQAYTFDENYDLIYTHLAYSEVDANLIPASQLEEIYDYAYDVNQSVLNHAIAMIVDGKIVNIFVNIKNTDTSEPPQEPEEPEIAVSEKFAIVENYNANLDKVTLLLANGTTASYEIHPNSTLTADKMNDFIYESTGIPYPPQERVVTYTTTGDYVRLIPATTYTALIDKEYNANTGKLGAVSITDSVNIIDATEYQVILSEGNKPSISDYAIYCESDFITDTSYSAYAFKSGDTYSFVIITTIGTTFTEESRFAVTITKPAAKMFDGEAVTGATALYKGEEITLYWETDATHKDGSIVMAGDAFFFTTDSDGFVKESYKIYNKANVNTIESGFADIAYGDYKEDDWDFNSFVDSAADIKLVAGVVTEVKNNSITFGLINNILDDNGNLMYGGTDTLIDGNLYDDPNGLRGMYTFGIADECNAYQYDAYGSGREQNKYAITDASSINESILYDFAFDGMLINYVYDTKDSPAVNYAVAMIVDGDVVCIYNIAQ